MEKSKAEEERRFMLLMVRDDVLLTILTSMLRQLPDALCLPKLINIPQDAQVLRVQYEYQYMAFGFLLAHDSFEKLIDGCVVPHINATLEEEYIDLKKIKENKL